MLINFDRPKITALILSIIYFLFYFACERFMRIGLDFTWIVILLSIVISFFNYFKDKQIISAQNRYTFSLYFSLFSVLIFILVTPLLFYGYYEPYNNNFIKQILNIFSSLPMSINRVILWFVISYIFLYFPAIFIAKNQNKLDNFSSSFLLEKQIPLLYTAFVFAPQIFLLHFNSFFRLSTYNHNLVEIINFLRLTIDYFSIILFTFLFYNAFKDKLTKNYKIQIWGFIVLVYFIFTINAAWIYFFQNGSLSNYYLSEIFIYLPMKLWLMYFIFEFITKLVSNLKTKTKTNFNDPIFMSSIMLFISAILVGIIAICFNLFRSNLFGMGYYSIIAFTGIILISFDLISSLYVSISYFIENKKPISLINLTKTAVFYALTFEIIYLMLTKDYLPHDLTSKYNTQNILILFTIGSVLLKIIIKFISSFISMASINGILYLIKINFLKNDELTQSES